MSPTPSTQNISDAWSHIDQSNDGAVTEEYFRGQSWVPDVQVKHLGQVGAAGTLRNHYFLSAPSRGGYAALAFLSVSL